MKKPEKKCKIILVLIYLSIILFITLFSREFRMKRSFRVGIFRPYKLWLSGNWIQGRMILKNIALFVPLGYYLVSSFSLSPVNVVSRKKVVCVSIMTGAAISLVVETAQYFSGRGIFDINDLLNNVVGTIVGVFLFLSIDRVWNGRKWL